MTSRGLFINRSHVESFCEAVGVEIFDGSFLGGKADDWFKKLDRAFESLHMTDLYKMVHADAFLRGSADMWYKRLCRIHGPNLTWGIFVREFHREYMTNNYKRMKRIEFFGLTQNGMRVLEYVHKFKDLYRFVADILTTEEMKCDRFILGLDIYIESLLASYKFKSFNQMVDKALAVSKKENEMRDLEQNMKGCHISLEENVEQWHFEGTPFQKLKTDQRKKFFDMLCHCMKLQLPVLEPLYHNPYGADEWFLEIDKAFLYMHMSDADKVLYVGNFLRGEADSWFKKLCTVHGNSLTWEIFVREFHKDYLSSLCGYLRFKNVKQNGRSVREYVDEFENMFRFVEYYMDTEDKCDSFWVGTDDDLKWQIFHCSFKNFDKMVDKALETEKLEDEIREFKENGSAVSYSGSRDRQHSNRKERLIAKQVAFFDLRQNGMTVAEYKDEFVQLVGYVLNILTPEEEVCNMFRRGLDLPIQIKLVGYEYQSFQWILKTALKVEEMLENEEKEMQFQKNSGNSSVNRWRQPCATCWKYHKGVCRKGIAGCFVCGEMGHIKRHLRR